MSERESFVFYRSYYEALKELNDNELATIIKAICEYSLNSEVVELDGVCKTAFTLIKPTLDSSINRRDASIENGKKGGRPRKNNLEKPNQNLEKPSNNLDITYTKPNQNLNVNVNVNDNVNVNKNVNKKEETYKDVVARYTSNISLVSSLNDYILMRKKSKGFTIRALELALNKLDKLATSDDEKIEIVNNSIMNGWKSFFPLKEEVKQKEEVKRKEVVPAWLDKQDQNQEEPVLEGHELDMEEAEALIKELKAIYG